MSLRHGVTAQEENAIKRLISQGKTWEQIAALCDPSDEKQKALIADANLDVVKKTIYEPLVKRFEAAKKAGHKTIHDLDKAEAAKKAEAKKLKEDLGE